MTNILALTLSDIERMRPKGGYQIIYADPPWKFAANSAAKPSKGARRHYDTIDTNTLCGLGQSIKHLAAKDSILLMWATVPMLPQAMSVLDAWGFKYKSNLVWPKGRIATGYWVRNAHEILLIGRRGKFPCTKPALFPTSIIPGRAREHSRKPEWPAEIVEARHPSASKLELFARASRPGWSVIGNQTRMFQPEPT